jgi:uncharacterized protein YkwD
MYTGMSWSTMTLLHASRRLATALLFMGCLSLALQAPAGAEQGYGVPVGDYPNWPERILLTMTNACRMAPQQFRDAHLAEYPGILQYAEYPPVPPLYWNLELNQAARSHAVDMATTPCFQHDSCDGTLWHVRIRSFYSENAALAENIAYGYSDSFAALLALLADGGAPDRSAGDGHRRNIMNGNLRELGCGYSISSRPYYVQDFGGGPPDFATPIAGGSHLFLNGGSTTFFANFFDPSGQSPQQASLVLDGEVHDLALHLGQPVQGTYSTELPRASDCRDYFFVFVDGGGTSWRYPEAGAFATTGEGGCSAEYTEEAISLDQQPQASIALHQNVPNPFRSWTSLQFELNRPGRVRVTVHNVAGRLVRTLHDGETPAGLHRVDWDGRDRDGRAAVSGIYFCRLQAGGASRVRQVLLFR